MEELLGGCRVWLVVRFAEGDDALAPGGLVGVSEAGAGDAALEAGEQQLVAGHGG